MIYTTFLYFPIICNAVNLRLPKKNIKVLLFEELTKSPINSSQEIFEFLEVDSSFSPNTKKKENVSGVPKGIFGWYIMKLRYYNLMPDIQFSKYLPDFIIYFLFYGGTIILILLLANAYNSVIAAVALGILSLIPCIGILVLLGVNQQATRLLRSNGIKVGFMGANMGQFD